MGSVKSQGAKDASLLALAFASGLTYVSAGSSYATERVGGRPIAFQAAGAPHGQPAPRRCRTGTLIIVEQPETQLLEACLALGSHLVVDLHPSTSQGPRWSGPPAQETSTILARTFSGTVH